MDRHGPGNALHAQLERALLERIERGDWATGDRLPTEGDLSAAYKVSRNTVRTALGALERRELVERHPGRGTFLRHRQFTHLMGWHEDAGDEFVSQGLMPRVRMLEFAEVAADSQDARRLGLALGAPLIVVRRLLMVGADTTGYTEHRLAADLAAGITADDFDSPYSEHAYRVLGIDLDRGTLLLSARAADTRDAELLAVAPGTPLFVYERTLLLANGRHLEWSQAILLADAARFRADFTVPRAPIEPTPLQAPGVPE